MTFPFRPLDANNLKSRIVENIRDAIIDGRLSPGQKVVERKLADSFQTSVTTVREALIHLEQEGFITKIANTKSFVTQFTKEQTQKLFQVRKWLEPPAAELAALNGSSSDHVELQAQLDRAIEAARSKSYTDYIRQDLRIHEVIWRMSGNEFLEQALRRIVMPLFALSLLRIRPDESFPLENDALSHKPIVDAIVARDAKAAERLLRAGLREWETQVVCHLPDEAALENTTGSEQRKKHSKGAFHPAWRQRREG